MKRSEINRALKEMEAMINKHCFALPPFCNFTPEEWKEKGHEYDEIRDNMLGWDITDYGLGKFDEVGFSLITIRNGNTKMDKYTKTYAEKLLYIREGQTSPMHFHWTKMEDIINRGGGNVLIRVYNSTKDEKFADTPVTVHCDGREMVVPAGTQIRLTPGESISIYPYMYHDFEVEPGSGPVLLGEVSMCNDDNTDNRFYEPMGRFPKIEEDEPPYRLLCNEYPKA
ncbi:MAG TPA: D-lyxose/D-mannose family sugar isomerase [Candidatus Blautia faecigallinarum]|uniref:D-lyxose ketol-isomerase n=1 Tax=Candidatus Blautia faecigallinarum TaxID=2838488 RepID=A0A9D2ITJ3_9FIRM|nr:D-lyxose/D-mannose family sugar isomerase [Candidatus Blautia faecigallinarum]